jgi:hypothetical protein
MVIIPQAGTQPAQRLELSRGQVINITVDEVHDAPKALLAGLSHSPRCGSEEAGAISRLQWMLRRPGSGPSKGMACLDFALPVRR